jgi:hypothetical protein
MYFEILKRHISHDILKILVHSKCFFLNFDQEQIYVLWIYPKSRASSHVYLCTLIFLDTKGTLFDQFHIANPSLARVLWCIGERGFVLGWESGMAIEEDPIVQVLEVGSK